MDAVAAGDWRKKFDCADRACSFILSRKYSEYSWKREEREKIILRCNVRKRLCIV